MSPTRSSRLVALLPHLACLIVVLIAVGPMLLYCEPDGPERVCRWSINMGTATDDGRYFGMVWEAARVALVDFHQLPSWNPYHCGGVVLYQDAQAPFPGPLFLLMFFWAPAIVGIKLWEIVHLVVGAFGVRRLAADNGANIPEQVLAAAVVTASGSILWHLGGGNLSFSAFLLFPWVLWAHRKALRAPRYAVVTGGLLALAAVEGGVYPLPLMLAALAIDTVARLGHADDRRALLVSLPITGALAGLLSAVRVLPLLLYLKEYPRLMPLDDQMTVAEVFQTWTTRVHDRPFPGHTFVWDEYGDYLSGAPVVLLLVGVAVALWKRDEHTRSRRVDLALLVGIVWLALGNIPAFSLYGLMHELPIYRSLRVPSRYLFAGNLGVAMLVVWAAVAMRQALSAWNARLAILRAVVVIECLVVAGTVYDMAKYNHPHIQRGVDPPMERQRASANFFQNSQTPYDRLPTHAMRGVGTAQCYVPMEWSAPSGLWDGEGPQVRLDAADAGTARQTRWSPNEITVDVALTRPARLIVNQNYETGWTASVGTTESDRRMLTVRLPQGRYTLTVRHRPPGLLPGLLLTVLGAALSVFVWKKLTPEALGGLRARASRWFSGAPRAEG